MCDIHDRSQTCLEENGIGDYCLATSNYRFLQMNFQFICHHQQRDENLVNSLQCLHHTRVMVMLYFHIANRCRGTAILDDIMRRYKNAYFYTMDIKPATEQGITSPLYCLPKSVISTCIRDIVEDKCGTMTADLVRNYLVYHQERFGQDLESAGLASNICDHDLSSDMVPSRPPMPSDHAKMGFSKLLEITAPGTALDTVYGKYILACLHNLPVEELCTTHNTFAAYAACDMYSEDKSENSKFNILHFAHQLLPNFYRGTQCSRLEQFTACWKMLQDICGPKVRELQHYATLFVESCNIQFELDTVGCHWQDMLLGYYIQASSVTVWPIGEQCLQNPMYLEDTYYGTFNSVMDDLDAVISLLQPGVEEISRKCGSQPAKRLRLLFDKIRYLQRDALKYTVLVNSIPN